MKKLIIFALIAGLLSSCYDPYRVDFEHSTVAFSPVTGGSNTPGVLYRTVVKDEGLHLDAGIYLAGILENTEERWADFVIDPTLLDGTDYKLMPESYYTLSNQSRFVIPAGDYIGRITITLDSALFINDTLSIEPVYAIPFRLTATSEDSILSTHSTQILVIKYINYYTGTYEHSGSFKTFSPEGTMLNQGGIDNELDANILMLDTIYLDGLMYLRGPNYMLKLVRNPDNTVSYEYYPNTGSNLVNAAKGLKEDEGGISYSYLSGWETVDFINDEYDPENSGDKGKGAYGNWPNPMTWNWLQYSFPANFYITKSEVYWWTDGGGIQIPFNTYVQLFDLETEQWVLPVNPVVNGVATVEGEYGETDTLVYNQDNPYLGVNADSYNVTEFEPYLTSAIRINFIATESQGVLEWKVWGVQEAASYEQSPIKEVVPNGSNSFDLETCTFELSYRVTYSYEEYHTDVNSTLVWRNRERDKVNEWRR